MIMPFRFALITLALLAISLPGCEEEPSQTPTDAKPVIYTAFYPTTYFTQRIAGDLADVVCPLPDGADPIFWQPDADTIAAYQRADLIIINGAGFEKWVEITSLPASRILDTTALFADEWLTYEHAVEHSHGPAGEHTHEGIDGHTWVDPGFAARQATVIQARLAEMFPDHAQDIELRYQDLLADLDGLATELRRLRRLGDPPLLASHPAYNYLARGFDLNIHSLDLDPQTMPDDDTFAEIKALLDTHPARYILWESAPADAIAARFTSELGLTSIVFSPCEMLSSAELEIGHDYMFLMRRNLEALAPAFGPTP